MSTTVEELEKTETSEDKKDELLLDSLEIKGYRCFEHLTIEKLGRVNLIVGKNNVGKTALLEALWIWCEGSSWNYVLDTLSQILNRRYEKSSQMIYENGKEYRHLFYNRPQKDSYQFSISSKKPISRIISETEFFEAQFSNKAIPVAEDMVGVEIKINKDAILFSTNPTEHNEGIFHKDINNLFVETRGLDIEFANEIWEEIIYKIKEDDVEKALRVILPELVDINFTGYPKGARNRVPVVRVKGINERVPLKSLGEGMNRLLDIALALVKSEKGVLMIDEIESGLHYSVLPDVWKLIFKTAKDLNVQVFATTHSKDCIEAFAQAAYDSPEDGMLVQLMRQGEKIVAKTIKEEMLVDAINYEVEVR